MVREMHWDGLEDLFDFDIEPLAKHQQTVSRTNTKIQNHTHTQFPKYKKKIRFFQNLRAKEFNPNRKLTVSLSVVNFNCKT